VKLSVLKVCFIYISWSTGRLLSR